MFSFSFGGFNAFTSRFLICICFSFLFISSSFALSGDPSDFVKPKTTKIVDGKLVTQYDIQYKGVVKQSSGFLNKLEVGKLMGKGFRKYFPALRALDLVQLALDSGLLFDTDSNTIYQKVEQKNNQVRVIEGTNILITLTANAPSGRTCMEAFNFYLANNQRNTTSATLVSCSYNYIDQIQLGMKNLNPTSMDYERNPESIIYRKLGTDLVSPSVSPQLNKVGDSYVLTADDEVIGGVLLDKVPVEQLAEMAVYTPEFQSPSALRAIEAVKNEFGDYEYKYDDVTTPNTGIGLAPSTDISSDVSSDIKNEYDNSGETLPNGRFTLPSFCVWARPVCDFIAIFDSNPFEDFEVKPVPAGRLSDVGLDFDRYEQRIDFSGQCPSSDFSVNIMGQQISKPIPYSHFCDFLLMIAPWLLASTYIGTAYFIVENI